MARKTAVNKSFITSLPSFGGVPTLAHQLNQAIESVVDDLHQGIVEDFMPIYTSKQRENVNVAFEKLKKELRRATGNDAKSIIATIQDELKKVRV